MSDEILQKSEQTEQKNYKSKAKLMRSLGIEN